MMQMGKKWEYELFKRSTTAAVSFLANKLLLIFALMCINFFPTWLRISKFVLTARNINISLDYDTRTGITGILTTNDIVIQAQCLTKTKIATFHHEFLIFYWVAKLAINQVFLLVVPRKTTVLASSSCASLEPKTIHKMEARRNQTSTWVIGLWNIEIRDLR